MPNFTTVFLSSTAKDLQPWRDAVSKAIAAMDGHQGVRMEGRKTIHIGEGALVGPFCCIENVNHRPEGSEELPVIIGKGAWIGVGSILLPGAEVGEGAVVAAGSVVRGRVAPRELWGGVPARPLRKLDHAPALAEAQKMRESEPLRVVKG